METGHVGWTRLHAQRRADGGRTPNPGEQADILRALGRFLDEKGADRFQIMNHGAFLSVSWDKGDSAEAQQSYQEHELDKLRAQARALRQGFGAGSPGGSLAELLRTLGQELDIEQVDLSSVIQTEHGFAVSGTQESKYFQQTFTSDGLVEMSAQRRAARTLSPAADARNDQSELLHSAMIGTPVFTTDAQKIGKIKDVRGRYFKVEGSFLQRDYWLPEDCVGTLIPGEKVLLDVSKAQLGHYKLNSVPAEA